MPNINAFEVMVLGRKSYHIFCCLMQ